MAHFLLPSHFFLALTDQRKKREFLKLLSPFFSVAHLLTILAVSSSSSVVILVHQGVCVSIVRRSVRHCWGYHTRTHAHTHTTTTTDDPSFIVSQEGWKEGGWNLLPVSKKEKHEPRRRKGRYEEDVAHCHHHCHHRPGGDCLALLPFIDTQWRLFPYFACERVCILSLLRGGGVRWLVTHTHNRTPDGNSTFQKAKERI